MASHGKVDHDPYMHESPGPNTDLLDFESLFPLKLNGLDELHDEMSGCQPESASKVESEHPPMKRHRWTFSQHVQSSAIQMNLEGDDSHPSDNGSIASQASGVEHPTHSSKSVDDSYVDLGHGWHARARFLRPRHFKRGGKQGRASSADSQLSHKR
jgi:hypothetical protein